MRFSISVFAAAFLGAALLAACGGANSDQSPMLAAGTARLLQSAMPQSIKQIQIATDSCCYMAVDPLLNHIYVSSGINLSGNHTTVVDGGGSSFSILATVNGFGGANNVDHKTHNIWLPGLYSGEVAVYSGITNHKLETVSLSDCPITSWVDQTRRYAWVAAQCGSDNDPVWAIDADSPYSVVAGPIGSGGVMGGISVLNPVTGKYYFDDSAGNFEINPLASFTLSPTSFGVALGVNSLTDTLYAQVPNGLNIVDGRTEKIEKTVPLSYNASFLGVNRRLNHIYLSAGNNTVQVREGTAGKLLKTIQLASGIRVGTLGGDDRRARIYAIGTSGSNDFLYQIEDKY